MWGRPPVSLTWWALEPRGLPAGSPSEVIMPSSHISQTGKLRPEKARVLVKAPGR